MAKVKTRYVCQNCGYTSSKWLGRCPSCSSISSFVEETIKEDKNISRASSWVKHDENLVLPITKVKEVKHERYKSSLFKSFNDFLDGGIVKGSVNLFAGEPGIGKSTFLLQLAKDFCRYGKVLYVSGEESIEQISLRARRLNALDENILVVSNNNLLSIKETIEKIKPSFLIIDSIQTMYLPYLESSPGSVSQIREGTAFLTNLCKALEIPAFIVGHVTKEGNIAGPKVLEHIVDALFFFEGDRFSNLRILKSFKNRFGKTGEVVVFEMQEKGLKEVENPSEFFLKERPIGKPGSVVFPFLEGAQRPILVEVQALITRAAFVTPQRKSQGYDYNRLSIIVALLEKELKLPLKNFDIFVNVVGGINIKEPAADLPVALAIISSFLNIPLKENVCAFGEIGLTGELRQVRFPNMRTKEALKMGFNEIIAPPKYKDIKEVFFNVFKKEKTT